MEKIKLIYEKVLAWLLRAKDLVVKLSLIVWGFLKKWGLHIINLIVLLIYAYDSLYGTFIADFVGLWLFFLLGYYIFWKLLGAEKLFKKDEF